MLRFSEEKKVARKPLFRKMLQVGTRTQKWPTPTLDLTSEFNYPKLLMIQKKLKNLQVKLILVVQISFQYRRDICFFKAHLFCLWYASDISIKPFCSKNGTNTIIRHFLSSLWVTFAIFFILVRQFLTPPSFIKHPLPVLEHRITSTFSVRDFSFMA